MNTEEYNEISQEQSQIVFRFLNTLFRENVQEYWDTISKVDQARVYGMYKAAITTEALDVTVQFSDYVREQFMIPQRELYERVKENPGVATHLRYSKEGEPQIFVLENVVAPRYYIAPAQERVFPVTITIDTMVSDKEVVAEWKVRMYIDQDYKYV